MNLINVYEKSILDAKHIIENENKEIERLNNIIKALEKYLIEEIEDKYLEITPNDIYSMMFTKDIKENKTKVVLKENK